MFCSLIRGRVIAGICQNGILICCFLVWLRVVFFAVAHMEHSTGTIIRLTRLTETSLIVHWCTQHDGLIKTVAKGARRPKSPFAGKLDLFFEGEINWVRSRKGELHTLREVMIANYRENLRKQYGNTLLASYFGELLAHVAEPGYPVPELFDLLGRGLAYLERNKADKRAMTHYEHEMARLLGVQHLRTSPGTALENAYGSLPRGRQACLDAMHGF